MLLFCHLEDVPEWEVMNPDVVLGVESVVKLVDCPVDFPGDLPWTNIEVFKIITNIITYLGFWYIYIHYPKDGGNYIGNYM